MITSQSPKHDYKLLFFIFKKLDPVRDKTPRASAVASLTRRISNGVDNDLGFAIIKA